MKAKKVKGLDPGTSFEQNARRIVEVRVKELQSLGSKALDPEAPKRLHDARIAAKRLRYVLELGAPALGKTASAGARVARDLQDLLGEIHDCDVMLPRVREHAEVLRTEDAGTLRAHAGRRRRDLPPEAVLRAPNLARYRGLEALSGYLAARREVLFERFVREWEALERRGFAEELVEGLSPRAQEPEAHAAGAGP
jgi:hypothetical protein